MKIFKFKQNIISALKSFFKLSVQLLFMGLTLIIVLANDSVQVNDALYFLYRTSNMVCVVFFAGLYFISQIVQFILKAIGLLFDFAISFFLFLINKKNNGGK